MPVVDRAVRRFRNTGTIVHALDLRVLLVGDVRGRVVLVLERRVDLRLGERGEPVLEEPARERGAQVLVPRDAALVVRADDERRVRLVVDELHALVLVHRLVDLDVLAAGQAHDASGLVAVQHDLAVLLLQRDADALRDEVRDPRTEEQQDLQGVDDALHRQ